jgi:hypothetical protein
VGGEVDDVEASTIHKRSILDGVKHVGGLVGCSVVGCLVVGWGVGCKVGCFVGVTGDDEGDGEGTTRVAVAVGGRVTGEG